VKNFREVVFERDDNLCCVETCKNPKTSLNYENCREKDGFIENFL
jgi:hypothetical protein